MTPTDGGELTPQTPGGGKRRHPRHATDLLVELAGGQGVTRDVSASGMFFYTDQPMVPGAHFEFSLVLSRALSSGPVRINGRGTVVRVEPKDNRLGVAAEIDECELTAAE